MDLQGELFAAAPIVPGLALVENAVSEGEARAIEAHIDAPRSPPSSSASGAASG